MSSPAKHLTTRPSTDRSKGNKRTVGKLALCGLALGCCLGIHLPESARADEPAASKGAATSTEEIDPIERLSRRSAVDRWKTLSDGWTNRNADKTKTESAPVAGPRMVPQDVTPRLQPVQTARKPEIPQAPAVETPDFKLTPQNNEDGLFYRNVSKMNQNDALGSGDEAYEIKKVSEINPFSDYEPDPDVAANDPCRNLCPKPGDCAETPNEEFKVCPEVETLTDEEYATRYIPPAHYAWAAPNLHYNPLYFEDVQLERYGHTYWEPVQPFVSVGKFGAQLIGLPYQMAIDPPHKKIYPLGYYRPGECAPKLHYQVPWNTKAAAVQAGATAGAILLVP